MENAIAQYRPAYFSGFENETVAFETREQLLAIPWVASFALDPTFHQFSISDDIGMMVAEYDEGREWWVVGKFRDAANVPLPRWRECTFNPKRIIDAQPPGTYVVSSRMPVTVKHPERWVGKRVFVSFMDGGVVLLSMRAPGNDFSEGASVELTLRSEHPEQTAHSVKLFRNEPLPPPTEEQIARRRAFTAPLEASLKAMFAEIYRDTPD